jgi:hypothetical protein
MFSMAGQTLAPMSLRIYTTKCKTALRTLWERSSSSPTDFYLRKDAPIDSFLSDTPSKDKRNGSSHILTKVNAKSIP